MWADRILLSDLAGQLLRAGSADQATLRDISAAWTRWRDDPDGWMSLLHGEILAVA